jgi:alkyl sulfatase BDS1-like metallo-beta-lactamase superfamily hydrolase
LNPLPPVAVAKHYVAFMGGADAVLKKAIISFNNNDFQWVCEVVQHVVNEDPKRLDARALLADALEQLGYQAESGPWRNFYLCGALELRQGVPKGSKQRISAGILAGMPMQDIFKAMAVRLNATKAEGIDLSLNLHFTDIKQPYLLSIRHSVLHAWPDRGSSAAAVNLRLTSLKFKQLMFGYCRSADLLEAGELQIDGDATVIAQLIPLFDQFDRRFPIMTPRPESPG